MADQLRERFPTLAIRMDGAEADALAFMTFPRAHRRQIRVTYANSARGALSAVGGGNGEGIRVGHGAAACRPVRRRPLRWMGRRRTAHRRSALRVSVLLRLGARSPANEMALSRSEVACSVSRQARMPTLIGLVHRLCAPNESVSRGPASLGFRACGGSQPACGRGSSAVLLAARDGAHRAFPMLDLRPRRKPESLRQASKFFTLGRAADRPDEAKPLKDNVCNMPGTVLAPT